MVEDRKAATPEAKGCVILISIETISAHAVEERTATAMEDVRARRFRQDTKKRVWKGTVSKRRSERTRW